jgi:hypothetical protein
MKNLTLTLWQSSATRNTYQAEFDDVTVTAISVKQLAYKLSIHLKTPYNKVLEHLTKSLWKRDNSRDWYLRNKIREDAKLDSWDDTRSFA